MTFWDKRLSISSEESVSDYEQVRRSEAGGSSPVNWWDGDINS